MYTTIFLKAITFLFLCLSSLVVSAPVSERYSADSAFYNGIATFYYQKGNAGACGAVNSDWAHIVALQTVKYAGGINCGRTIQLTDTNTGRWATAVVADECPSCETEDSIDLSEGLFEEFPDLSAGVFNVRWRFID